LRVLTSGPLPPNPSELLGSQRMRRLVQHLQERADIVIFDSPPMLAVADAAVIASMMDGTLLVIEASATRREALQRAKESLNQVGANILGVALNKLSANKAAGYYYYYYYQHQDRARQRRRKRKPYTFK
jgi:capsular exopolysaccharide synthesis family protein